MKLSLYLIPLSNQSVSDHRLLSVFCGFLANLQMALFRLAVGKDNTLYATHIMLFLSELVAKNYIMAYHLDSKTTFLGAEYDLWLRKGFYI